MAGVPVTTLRLRPARPGASTATPSARVPALREETPRGVGGILDRAVEILGARFGTCFGLAFLVQVPATLIERAFLVDAVEFSDFVFGLLPALAAKVMVALLVASVVGPRVLGRGRAVPLSPLTLFELGGLVLLSALGILLVFCCIAPGVVWLWLVSVVPMVYLFEPRVGRGFHLQYSLGRGIHLVRGIGNFGRWLGITSIAFLVFAPVQSAVGTIELPQVQAYLRETLGLSELGLDVLEVSAASFFVALSTSFEAVLFLVFYAYLRTHREGLDLELALADMGEARAAADGADRRGADEASRGA